MSEIQPVERTIVANGIGHHVLEWSAPGALRTVICCHGYLDVGASWHRVAQHLVAQRRRVVAFDFRGHGGTEWVKPGGYYHFADYVFDLSDLAMSVAPDGFDLDQLMVLGPVTLLKLKYEPEGYGRKLVAELWLYPDGSRILELSTKCAPAEAFDVAVRTRAYLSERGVDLSGEQQTKTRTALEYFSAQLAE